MTGPHSFEKHEIPEPDPEKVRAALARVLACSGFQTSAPLTKALRAAVEDSLAGRPCKLKKASGDQLRQRLAEYYAGEGRHDVVRIEFPANGAAPCFSSIAPPVIASAPTPSVRRWRLWIPATLAIFILLVWVGLGWRARAASAQVRSLAILPLLDPSPGDQTDLLSDGITDATIDNLARIPGLHVAERNSSFAFKGHTDDIAAAGRELGVTAILRGNVRRADGRLHLAVEMDRVSDQYRLWSATFDWPADDVFHVQQALASAIAQRIQIHSAAIAATRHRPAPAAYVAYLQGREFFDPAKPGDFDKAAERLEESTRIDPDFALAWAWLSIVREYRVSAGIAKPNQAMPRSRDAAERAVALDPECGDSHLALGIVRLQYDWDWAGAKEELDRGLQASPGSALALQWRAHWYQAQGRYEEAMADLRQALALNPLSSVLQGDMATQYLAMNQAERAVPFAQKAVELAPGDVRQLGNLAGVLFFAGQKEQARKMADAGNLPAAARAILAAQLGDPAPARQILDEAEDLPDEELLPEVAYVLAAAAIHDWDRCFSWLEEAHGERDVQLPYLRLSPLMPQSDPRFAAFLARMNLPEQAAR